MNIKTSPHIAAELVRGQFAEAPVDAIILSETPHAEVPAVKPERTHVAIAYNPYSLDSLLGAAQAVFHPMYQSARMVPYNQFASIDNLQGFTHILFVGVELTQLDFTALMGTTECKVTLVYYRDSYDWLTDKMLEKLADRVTVMKPNDDWTSELLARTDNTAIKVIQFWMDKEDVPVNVNIKELTSIASRVASQSYPILSFKTDLNEGSLESEEELANKARIHDAIGKLRTCLSSAKVFQELQTVSFKADVDAYLSYFRHIRYTLTRSMRVSSFRQTNGRLSSTVINLPVVPASEMTHSDILHAALQHYKEVLTYEDVREYRVWRIYSDKAVDRRKIATIFKPIMTWSEGAVLCALTHAKTATA